MYKPVSVFLRSREGSLAFLLSKTDVSWETSLHWQLGPPGSSGMSHTDEVQSKLQHLKPIQNIKDVQLQHVHKLESFISQQCKRINKPFAFFVFFFLFPCTLLMVTVLCICIRITPCDVYLFRFTCALLVPFYKESKCFDPLRITSMNPRNYLLFYVHNALVHSFFE